MPPRTIDLTAAERKVRRIRLAGKLCWYLSAAMTVNFVRQVLSAALPDEAVVLLLSLVVAFAVQYVLTMTESALFDGTLPAPWNVEWREGGSTPWLVIGAIVCLLLDVLLNIGGVAYFLGKLGSTDLGQSTLKVNASIITGVVWLVTVTFAVFIAVGPELLDEFANLIEDQNRPMIESRQAKSVQQPAQQQQQQPSRQEAERIRQQHVQNAREAAEKRNAAIEVKQ